MGYNDLKTTNPKLASEWNYTKNNNLKPEMFTSGSSKKVWWKCSKGHEWEAIIGSRTSHGCPYCNNKKALSGFNDLKTLFPDIALDFDREKNKCNPEEEVLLKVNLKYMGMRLSLARIRFIHRLRLI